MSSYSIEEIFDSDAHKKCNGAPPESIVDRFTGVTTLNDWMNYGIVGWDEGLGSYYIHGPDQIDGKELDQPAFWFSGVPRIPSHFALQVLLSQVFAENAEDFAFPFRKEALSKLKNDRDSDVQFPREFIGIDDYWEHIAIENGELDDAIRNAIHHDFSG